MKLLPACFVFATLVAASVHVAAAEPAKRATENVILYMTDGLRWQEVFGGADAALMNAEAGGVKDVDELKAKFWRDTPQERREAPMPFFWSVMAKQGQVFGNQAKGSMAKVTNGMHFSYPGYNETLCGFADPRIDSNDKNPNHNVTVFEWLNRKPGFGGKVAAFGVWDCFPYIFNRQRCGFPINAAREPLTVGEITPRIELLNDLKAQDTAFWAAEPFDSLMIFTALEYMKLNKPRLMFLSINETDGWGHAGRYDLYLDAARRADDCLRRLWETAQSMPEYRGKTSIIFVPDHGRGDVPVEWKSHGEKVAQRIHLAGRARSGHAAIGRAGERGARDAKPGGRHVGRAIGRRLSAPACQTPASPLPTFWAPCNRRVASGRSCRGDTSTLLGRPHWEKSMTAAMLTLALCLTAADPAPVVMPTVHDPRLKIELIAAEPDLVTPTGLAVDGRGRVLVVECHTHFRPPDYEGPAADRIRMFEDADGDGRFEKVRHVLRRHRGHDEHWHSSRWLGLCGHAQRDLSAARHR